MPGLRNLLIGFGKSSHYRLIPIRQYVEALGPKLDGLTFFHALSNSDPTASFVGHGKSRCFKVWDNNPQFDSTFRELSTPGIELTEKLIGEVEAYVIKL